MVFQGLQKRRQAAGQEDRVRVCQPPHVLGKPADHQVGGSGEAQVLTPADTPHHAGAAERP